MLEATEVLEVEASDGICFTERLAMLALVGGALEGGAAIFLGSNLDFFSAAPGPAAVVEGRFLLSREAIVPR
jgi:hypothetical protein